MSDYQSIKWYDRPLYIILLCVFLAPVGILLMWRAKLFSPKTRKILTAIFGFLFLYGLILSEIDKPKQAQSPSKVAVSQQQAQPAIQTSISQNEENPKTPQPEPPTPKTFSTSPQSESQVGAKADVATTLLTGEAKLNTPEHKYDIPIPTSQEIAIYEAFDQYMNEADKKALERNPTAPLPDTEILKRRFAKEQGMTLKELKDILLKVNVYRASRGDVIQQAVESIVKAIVGNRFEKVNFNSSMNVAVVFYQSEIGWTEKDVKTRIQREWILIINDVMKNVPDVQEIQIAVHGKAQTEEMVKAATITVKRNQLASPLQNSSELYRFQTWYHPSLR